MNISNLVLNGQVHEPVFTPVIDDGRLYWELVFDRLSPHLAKIVMTTKRSLNEEPPHPADMRVRIEQKSLRQLLAVAAHFGEIRSLSIAAQVRVSNLCLNHGRSRVVLLPGNQDFGQMSLEFEDFLGRGFAMELYEEMPQTILQLLNGGDAQDRALDDVMWLLSANTTPNAYRDYPYDALGADDCRWLYRRYSGLIHGWIDSEAVDVVALMDYRYELLLDQGDTSIQRLVQAWVRDLLERTLQTPCSR